MKLNGLHTNLGALGNWRFELPSSGKRYAESAPPGPIGVQ